jgi:hypothetical protein
MQGICSRVNSSFVFQSPGEKMEYYFVAKNKNGRLVGQLALEEIIRRFQDGELPGHYVAAAATGGSYAEFMKSGIAPVGHC